MSSETSNLGFKFNPAPYMYQNQFSSGTWGTGTVEEKRLIQLDPMCAALSYGPAWFEGLKARRTDDGRILLFRPYENASRARRSAERLGMKEIPLDMFVRAVVQTIRANSEFVPPREHGDLYIRPQSFGIDALLGLGSGENFIFTVSANPVGQYFPGGMKAKRFLVCVEHCRAAPGGTGDIKAAGNYAGANVIARDAKKNGYAEVIWLDPEKQYPQEIGAANLFWVKSNVLYTPPLDGMTLPGITRDSVIRIAEKLGITVESQEPHPLSELLNADEAFGTGTAAGITPVGGINYQGLEYRIGDGENPGEMTQELHRQLTGIQYGRLPDLHDWNIEIPIP